MHSPDAQTMFDDFCRHLVALQVVYFLGEETKERTVQFYSGTLLCVENEIYFLTAGHVLEDLREICGSPEVILHSVALVDCFRSDAKYEEAIPFDFDPQDTALLNRDEWGLDFGIIPLRPHYVSLLAKNEVVAISEQQWRSVRAGSLDGYYLVGLPSEFTESTHEKTEGGFETTSTVSPTMIRLERLPEAPEGSPETTFPRFIGRIQDKGDIKSIKGMSGGPIVGLERVAEGRARYWIVAIQSSWLESKEVTFGCPIPVLAEMLKRAFINELVDEDTLSDLVKAWKDAGF